MPLRRPIDLAAVSDLLAVTKSDTLGLIGVRNGLRVLPKAIAGHRHFSDPPKVTSLLRAGLTAMCQEKFLGDNELKFAANLADNADPASFIGRDEGASEVLMAADAVMLGLSAGNDRVDNFRFIVRGLRAASNAISGMPDHEEVSERLAEELDFDLIISKDQLLVRNLWRDFPAAWHRQHVKQMLEYLAEAYMGSTFWLRWWTGVSSGEQLDWNLQRDVALIPDDVWKAGPKAVITAIAEIESRFSLKAEVAALRLQLQQYEATAILQASAVQRSHNQPPVLIEPELAVGRQISVMIGALIEAEEELAKPDPKPGLLTRIAEVLVQGAKAIALYCGSLADVALKKAAEEVGSTGVKWGLRVGGLAVASQLEPIQTVAKALIDFVKAYHGG